MRHRGVKFVLAVAAGVLALGVAVASAGRFSISNKGIRITFNAVEFGEFARCPVTLEGTLHQSTIPKFGGMLIGYITRATTGRCSVGSAVFLPETLPWHIRYSNFLGSLPRISSLRWLILDVSWQVQQLLPCLYRAAPESAPGWNIELRLTAGRVEAVVLDETLSIRSRDCPVEMALRGTGAMSVLASATAITVTLI